MCQKEHPDAISEVLANLAAAPRRLERLASSLSPRAAATRPAPDKWSAKEIICHLADCELVYGFRYRKILAEPDAALVPFDQDAWAKSLQYQSQSLKSALAAFGALRNAHVVLFKSLAAESWERSGRHPDYGVLTLKQLVSHLASHDQSHVAQIERLCPPPKPRKKAAAKVKVVRRKSRRC
jgi:uncharacterized damage-inducible protein DinB